MAFMMPVVKKDFNLYPGSGPSSGRSSRSQSGASSMSGSPRGSNLVSFMSSPRNSTSPAFPATPSFSAKGAGSQSSLTKFHNRLVDKLRKTFKSKDDSGESSAESTSRYSISAS